MRLFSIIGKISRGPIVTRLPEELSNAIKKGEIETVKRLIENNPLLIHSEEDTRLGMPLHWAVEFEQGAIAQYLLSKGADPNAANRKGRISLHYSMRQMQTQISQLLITNKANINHPDDDGETPLNEAVLQNNLVGVRLLIQHGVIIDAKDKARGNNTALHLAAEMGDVEMVTELLNAGAEVNETNGVIYADSPGTYTPLHNYACLGAGKARSVLEAQGFRIGEQCASEINGGGNYTPLHLAALRGHKPIYNLLISAHADKNLKARCGSTAELLLKEYEDFTYNVNMKNNLRPS